MDHFGALSAFVQAAHTRSFTEAGRRIGVSSSAVGKAVARRGRVGRAAIPSLHAGDYLDG